MQFLDLGVKKTDQIHQYFTEEHELITNELKLLKN